MEETDTALDLPPSASGLDTVKVGRHEEGHGEHAPPAPKYFVVPPASEAPVQSWIAYGIFLLLLILAALAVILPGLANW